VTQHIRQLQKHQFTMIRQAQKEIATNEKSASRKSKTDDAEGRIVALAERLTRIAGIGAVSSWTLAAEVFAWRDISNRRQLAAFVGLVPTPFSSGNEEREQGISKSGRSDLRVLMIEVAWFWLRYQPDSELARWYCRRFAGGTSRERKRGIVALARKLLVALGKYINGGEIPAGAKLGGRLVCNYSPALTSSSQSTGGSAEKPAAA
jgi:transposase